MPSRCRRECVVRGDTVTRCVGFVAKPSRGFVPAADLLFAPPRSRQKALPCETANSQVQQPAGGGIPLTPFSPAEERKTRSPRAQHASSSDSRRLFEQSVAARVRHGASGLSTAGNPQRSVGRGGQGGALWLLSGGPENRRFRRSQSDSPAEAKTEGFAEGKSRHGTRQQPTGYQA